MLKNELIERGNNYYRNDRDRDHAWMNKLILIDEVITAYSQ